MKIGLNGLRCLLLLGMAFGMVSCATVPPEPERSVGFTANSGAWQVTVLFDPVAEVYRLSGRDAYNVPFDEVLDPIRRSRPFVFEGRGRYGWYGGKRFRTDVVSQGKIKMAVEHAYYDFPDAHMLDDFLSVWCSIKTRWQTVLTSDGILVEVSDFNRDDRRHVIIIGAYRLLIQGQPPPESFLRPYVHGRFTWLNASSDILSFFGAPFEAE